ncbi:hypothetical protein TrST_g11863 [Triparma strigata]|uniref:Phosphoglucomutase n=1 Tax=Triparma strigata TaxID=1606541 RepID=A0A9W7B4N7_9STRA|nr:hypothetical protein TrST_g11863 [Triparma strigata]
MATRHVASGRSAVLRAAENYVKWDPNVTTRSAVSKLLDCSTNLDGNLASPGSLELKSMFTGRLKFGTAGLRAPFGPGYNCMNELTVLQTAQGLLSYLKEDVANNVKEKGVVIGYDHRCSSGFTDYDLSSKQFAMVSAAVFASQNVPVYLFPDLVATPLVPFATTRAGAACGIMVTASHNPKDDTGYKLYWGNGAQIISPHDANISRHILENLEPWGRECEGWGGDFGDAVQRVSRPTGEFAGEYFERLRTSLCSDFEGNEGKEPNITYTAMHGVGHAFTKRSFEAFGLSPFVSVSEQQEPDPEFSTVAFPNPEEGEGALKLAMEQADRVGSRVILANDPDADRLAVCEKVGGGWRLFTGNEIGNVLGHWMFKKATKGREDDKRPIAMLASTVSSKFLSSVAAKEGFLFEETLTGFKWMGNRSEELRKQGYNVVFAYEEAIGYCCGDVVKDKDGVSAAAIVAEMVVKLRQEGMTIADYLLELKETYGFYVAKNSYVKILDEQVLEDIFGELRNGGDYLQTINGVKVASVRDLTLGLDSSTEDKKSTLPADPSSQFVTFMMENGAVVSLRTSGTEPKLKYYVEAVGKSEAEGGNVAEALVEGVLNDIIKVKCRGYQLTLPP